MPTSATSQMITFYFENGSVLTMRTSGTEPKIKYYTEMIGSSREECNEKLNILGKKSLLNDDFVTFYHKMRGDLEMTSA